MSREQWNIRANDPALGDDDLELLQRIITRCKDNDIRANDNIVPPGMWERLSAKMGQLAAVQAEIERLKGDHLELSRQAEWWEQRTFQLERQLAAAKTSNRDMAAALEVIGRIGDKLSVLLARQALERHKQLEGG